MLRHTFCHLPRITENTERDLWRAGITSWEMALGPPCNGSPLLRRLSDALLRESVTHLTSANAAWFARCLPPAQLWRLFHDFRSSCAYLDIETTGFPGTGHITTIALYDGRTLRTYVRGDNLDRFAGDIRDYRLLVTYNGKSFDLPFIARDLGVRLEQPHLDLRYLLKGLGFKGGLKSCERQVGLKRAELEDVDGFVAVLLWEEYHRRHNERALETLLAYNVQDTMNLETLLIHAFNRKLAELDGASFTAEYRAAPISTVANPYRADRPTVQRVLRSYPGPRPFDR